MEHIYPSGFLNRCLKVHVIGCGGTGTQVMSGLARLHLTMLELGHPSGLDVTVWDNDIVEPHNIGRQLFFAADVGRNKAEVMVNRLNLAYGLTWKGEARKFSSDRHRLADLVIGCVDTKSSRKVIAEFVSKKSSCYWLDFGNRSGDGQILLGFTGRGDNALPLPSELLPELVEGDEDTETPTCSVRASISRQGLFLNQQVATWGLEILFRLLTKGRISWHGVFVNAESGSATKIDVDPVVWKRFGFVNPQPVAA